MKKYSNYQLMTFVALFSVVMILTTCKKDEKPPSPDAIVIAKEVQVIKNQTWQDQFISLDSTNYTIIFSKNITATQQIKVGDIIVSGAGEGLLRKVKTLSTVNNEIKVQTEPATLTEAVQQGLVEYNQPLTISQIKSIDYHYAGVKLNTDNSKGTEQTQFSWDINTVLYDNDGNLATTSDQIKLIGTFNCDWRIALRIDVGLLAGLKEVKFGYESSENLDLQLIAGMQYSFEKKITLATVNFTPIVVTIGIVPIVFTPQLKISVGIDGSANASVTSKITQSMSFNAGIQYLKGQGWSPYNTFDKNIGFQPPQLNMDASAGAYLKPELLIKIYAIAGPYANLKLYGRVDANLLQTPWWKLYGGITMDAGAKVDIIDKFTLDYTVSDIIKYEQLLAQATSPPVSLPSLTTAAITSITRTTASSGGNITSNGGATVTASGVCWSTTTNPTISLTTKTTDGSVTGAFTSSITGLTANTTYYVRAYATNSIGTAYGTQVSFTTSAASPVIPTLTTVAATSITQTTASSGGNITSNGGATVTASGVCWSTTTNPTISLSTKTTDGSAIGAFTSSITGLTASTTYYVRAYATNSVGTAYGNELTFTTSAVASTVPGAPTIGTATAGNGQATVTFTALVSDGGSAITGYTVTSGPGNFTGIGSASPITVTGLTNGTAYTFIVTATNANGTSSASSASNSVTPSATLTTVSDIEGNIYNTVTIGTQTWMAENLKTTKYNDGTAIPNITDNTAWPALTTGAYSDYSNTPANSTTYGRLYNWYAVDNNAATKVASNGGKNVCPTSWHVSSDAEWTTLTTLLGSESVAGGKLKETGTTYWASPNTGATNETGFTALPGGYRYVDGTYGSIGNYGDWWSSTEYSATVAWSRYVGYSYTGVDRVGTSKLVGFSVRCLRDF